jgi:hypothetical protein
MSIRSLITPQNKPLPLYCSSINQTKLMLPLASAKFTATPPTSIIDFGVSGFLFSGATGSTPSANFYFSFIGGILGSATVALKSANLLTTYFSAVIPTDGSSSVIMSAVSALPSSSVPLVLTITSDATCNSTWYPISLEFNY